MPASESPAIFFHPYPQLTFSAFSKNYALEKIFSHFDVSLHDKVIAIFVKSFKPVTSNYS